MFFIVCQLGRNWVFPPTLAHMLSSLSLSICLSLSLSLSELVAHFLCVISVPVSVFSWSRCAALKKACDLEASWLNRNMFGLRGLPYFHFLFRVGKVGERTASSTPFSKPLCLQFVFRSWVFNKCVGVCLCMCACMCIHSYVFMCLLVCVCVFGCMRRCVHTPLQHMLMF